MFLSRNCALFFEGFKMEKKIIRDCENGISLDVIISRYINKRGDNKDAILKVIKDYRWNKWRKTGIK